MKINEPVYFGIVNRYLLDAESPNLERTPPYDFYFPFSKWEEKFRIARFLGNTKDFLDEQDLQKSILNCFPQIPMRN